MFGGRCIGLRGILCATSANTGFDDPSRNLASYLGVFWFSTAYFSSVGVISSLRLLVFLALPRRYGACPNESWMLGGRC